MQYKYRIAKNYQKQKKTISTSLTKEVIVTLRYIDYKGLGKMTIPVVAKTNPKELDKIRSLKQSSVIKVLLHFVHSITNSDQCNIVQVAIEQIAKDSNLGRKAVIESIKTLEYQEALLTIKQSTYFISPNICWFGHELDWAIYLKDIKEGTPLEEIYKKVILKKEQIGKTPATEIRER